MTKRLLVPMVVVVATSCAPKTESTNNPSGSVNASIPDSIVLERSVCFGACPAYRLRLAANGDVLFQPQKPAGPTGNATITTAAYAGLVNDFEKAGFYGYPDNIQSDSLMCGRQATDHPGAIVTTFRGTNVKRVEDYHGCHGTDGRPDIEKRLTTLRDLEVRIDTVAGTSRWIRR
jgi:hypothetical protein